jgi:hypothetical protein
MPPSQKASTKHLEKRKMLQEKYAYLPKPQPVKKILDPKQQLLHDFK